jgi:acyl-CoA synthetase (NDP forming)
VQARRCHPAQLVGAKPPFRVHAVNPHGIGLAGAQWSPTVEAVPERCDLAVIAVPASQVPGVVADIARNGAKLAVLVTAGLDKHAAQWAETLHLARMAGLRLVGPNCLGLLVPAAGLDASFAAGGAIPGQLAFLSQSGALATAVLDWARGRKIGFARPSRASSAAPGPALLSRAHPSPSMRRLSSRPSARWCRSRSER